MTRWNTELITRDDRSELPERDFTEPLIILIPIHNDGMHDRRLIILVNNTPIRIKELIAVRLTKPDELANESIAFDNMGADLDDAILELLIARRLNIRRRRRIRVPKLFLLF